MKWKYKYRWMGKNNIYGYKEFQKRNYQVWNYSRMVELCVFYQNLYHCPGWIALIQKQSQKYLCDQEN